MSCRCSSSMSYIFYALAAAAFIVLMANQVRDDDDALNEAQALTAAQHQHDHDQDHDHGDGAHQHGQAAQPQQQNQNTRGFPDLVTGLKNTEGCLGVETAQTSSGKNCIFAWFENKQAVMNWYNSETHQRAMNMFFPASEGDREPMKGVPDDIPIMAIASITMNDEPQQQQTNLPVSQIAIELYTPVTGGLHVGDTFAPAGLDVPDMKDYGTP